jgi:hypothetical protein
MTSIKAVPRKIVIEGKSLPIRGFELDWMCENPSIAMVAKRGSGKSWVCRAILNHLNNIKIPCGVIISPTDDVNPFYDKFFPGLYIHHKYTSDIIENLLYRQRKMEKKFAQKKAEGKKIDRRAILLMDDCLGSKKSWVRDEPIQKMFYNGRHYKLTFILTMQYPLGIPPDLRSNFDYIFLLADDSFGNQKKLYEQYAGMFPSVDAFRQVFNELTKDFGSMVIVNRGNRKQLWDKIFWFKVTDDHQVDFGSKQFKKIHCKNFDKNWDDNPDKLCMDNIMPQKRGSKQFKINLVGR